MPRHGACDAYETTRFAVHTCTAEPTRLLIVLEPTFSPDEWNYSRFNADPIAIEDFLRENSHVGNTSVPNRQNRALLFDSMLFHQSDPFRFKKGTIEK